MDRIIIFAVLGALIAVVSWRSIFKISSHGFYRFFSWLCIAWLIASNYKYWFDYPFSFLQIISWIFLVISAYLVISGVVLMKNRGNQKVNGSDKTLYRFEQTTEIVDIGIFKYIRHPLYSSLIFLAWAIFLKNTTHDLLFITILSTIFLCLTALFEEQECIKRFGDKYIDYMTRSKRFIPYIF